MDFKTELIPSFGVAGNFTGHLEQAGEARDFTNIKTAEANAPKALFPTFLPPAHDAVPQGVCESSAPQGGQNSTTLQGACGADTGNAVTPAFLHTFPFTSDKIIFPKGEEKLQIEPECAILCDMVWNGDIISEVVPKTFAASNDCSIRKEGAKKISQKKNWGPASKGLSENQIELTGAVPQGDKDAVTSDACTLQGDKDAVARDASAFSKGGLLDKYRIASFLVRDGKVFDYGEDSAVRDYSYIYEKLLSWICDKLNNQKDEGPAENIHAYLLESGKPSQVMISIGATRYTDFGEHNFLAKGDRAVVVVYPENKYDHDAISNMVKNQKYDDSEVSVLDQVIEL
ncbi:MAG: DUF5718 family protein [Treponema sp.]|nr:DUF5718 family protein [Treponema sp.]